MSKIYLAAINWLKIGQEDAYNGVSIYEACTGTDIAYFVGSHPYPEWRVYPFTTKKERDALVAETLKKGEQQ